MIHWMMALAIVASATLATLYFALRARPFKGIPQRNPLPFFGGLIELVQNWETVLDYLLNLQKKHNYKTVGVPGPFVGSIPGGAILIWSPENVEHVLQKNFKNYVKGKNFRESLGDFLGDGIFASDGHTWKRHRKVGSRMFSRKLMRAGTSIALSNAKEVIDYIKKKASTNSAFDIADTFFCFTIDTFVEIAFGEKLGSLKKKHPFALAFDTVQYLSEKRFRNPLYKVQKWLPANEQQEIRRHIATMDAFAMRVIRKIRERHKKGTATGKDLITRFILDAKQQGLPSPTAKELRDIVMNFIIAGRDTTACALSWQFYNICRDTEKGGNVVNTLLKEVEEGMKRIAPNVKRVEDLDHELAFELMTKHLPYLNAVTKETLRLYPSVPKNVKYACADDTLPDGTFVPSGIAVIWSPYCMGRNPNIWENAETYDPSRWFEDGDISKSLKKDPSTSVYPAFQMMPRLCLGKPLALMEINLLTVILLQNFSFKAVSSKVPEYKSTLVLPMKHGFDVRAKGR